jgi:integrase
VEKPELQTFGEFVDEWKRQCWSKRKPSTQAQYNKLLRLYFGPLIPIPVEGITAKVIDRWIDYLKDEKNQFVHVSTRTGFRHELRLLTTILKYYVEVNDETKFVLPIKRRHRDAILLNKSKEVRHKDLTESEFLKFRDELSKGKRGQQMAILATVQFYQALRISEAAAIHWEDLRLDSKVPKQSRLRCTKSVYWARTRGTRAQVVHSFKNARANSGVKESPLMPATFTALMRIHSSNAKGLVFADAGAPLEYRWIQAAYDRAFARVGLNYSATHIMRHGMTRKVYNETGDLALAGQLLGNTTEQSIRVYAKRSTQALNQYVEKKWESDAEAGCNWLQKPDGEEET